MFNFGADTSLAKQRARRLAESQVRAKFPDLAAGSSGWYRAVENRYRRIIGA